MSKTVYLHGKLHCQKLEVSSSIKGALITRYLHAETKQCVNCVWGESENWRSGILTARVSVLCASVTAQTVLVLML